jgi:mannose-1-phosphate guanylyltransferase
MALPLTAVVMAGGSGTRFWPASRRARPKQVLDLTGSGRSMIAETVARARPVADRVLVVATEELAPALRAELPDLAESDFLWEPVGRNTAPCIGLAAIHAARRGPTVLAVLPADHHVSDPDALRAALRTAANAAEDGALVTLGITPTRPETGYGWLEVGDPVSPGVHALARFVEKPDRARAEAFLAGGRHLWNGGMFVFRANAILDAIATHLPPLHEELLGFAMALAESDALEARRRRERYADLRAISIDYGVMEKVKGALVVPCDCGWSDVGSFAAAWELAKKDAEGNAGVAVAVDARRNLAHASGKTVTLVGVDDLVVVDTPDAILVVPRERAQEVRAVVEALEKSGKKELL